MQVIGSEVELVGVPFTNLKRFNIPGFDICEEIFAHHVYYSPEKIFRDVPEFRPAISLAQGIEHVLAAMDADGRVPDAASNQWEDAIIDAQQQVGARNRISG